MCAEEICFGALTWPEIRRRADDGWLVLIPTGCTEQQGPHLPVDFDTWFAGSLCRTAAAAATAQGAPTLSMPACPFGPTPEHRNFGSGYVDLPQTLHETLYFAVLVSLAEQGFRRLVIWQGCGGHRLQTVVRRFNTKNRGQAKAFLPPSPFHDIWCRVADPSVPGGHADSFATSISLYLRPQSVRQEQIVDPHNSPVDWGDPALDFARYSPTGVIGDPTQASAALGQKLWEASVAALVSALAEAASATL